MLNYIKFIWPYIRTQKLRFTIISLSILSVAALETAIPLTIKEIIVTGIPSKNLIILALGILYLIGLGSMDWLVNILARHQNNRFSQKIQYDIRRDIYDTLQYQDLEFYSKESIGQIMARTIEEVYSLQDILGWGYRILLLTISLFIGTVISLMLSSTVLGLIFLLAAPLILLLLTVSSKKNAEVFYTTRFRWGKVNEVLAENFSGIKTVKSFGRENEQIEDFNTQAQDYYDAAFKEIKVTSVLQPGMIFIISNLILLILVIGVIFVQFSIISIGDLVAFILLGLQIAVPGRFLGDLAIQAQMANTAARRLNEILQSKKNLVEDESRLTIPHSNYSITFDHVSFKYPNNDFMVLKDVNFSISKGERIAILGPTGSGKTTLINLIPRFFDPISGDIYFDDHNIKEFSLKSVRDLVTIIHQDSFLFTLSIKDNILFGSREESFEEVVKVAKIAQIHDTIIKLPQGYDTIVGERGVTLSGGQRQRVAIARALMTKSPILIFDDSVSAVDPETEGRIQKELSQNYSDKTVIIISQRPSSLKYVDRVLVLEDGVLTQDGSQQELMDQDGLYKKYISVINNQMQNIVSWNKEEYLLKDEGDRT